MMMRVRVSLTEERGLRREEVTSVACAGSSTTVLELRLHARRMGGLLVRVVVLRRGDGARGRYLERRLGPGTGAGGGGVVLWLGWEVR